MHASAECNMTRVERNCGKEGSSWYFTMKSIFKIHQSTVFPQLVLGIVHPLNPPILSYSSSFFYFFFSCKIIEDKKRRKENRMNIVHRWNDHLSQDLAINLQIMQSIRYHERCCGRALNSCITSSERIRQGWCVTRSGRKVRPLKQTLIPMERVTTRTVAVT